MEELQIRRYNSEDCDQVWEIISAVIANGETYVFDPDSSREKMLNYWLAPDKHVYVASIGDEIVGTFNFKANQPDRGSHIANASYMVSPRHGGKGIGESMGRYSLDEARRAGFKAMQFNIVIKSNERAVKLWEKIGFQIIGEIPKAFDHPKLGMTNAFIMYREL